MAIKKNLIDYRLHLNQLSLFMNSSNSDYILFYINYDVVYVTRRSP